MAVRGKHGAMLAGRYRLLEQLGEGGMGSVWKAEHLLLHSHVAIKIIDPEVARLEFNLARFLREAKTLATLRSPNVVQVLDFGSDADAPYLVMELLQGQTLGRRLSEQKRLSLSETSRVLHDVCTAMALVHEQGLIHRDLKPENIFLCNTGDQRVTKVVDFGIAKSMRGDMSASMKTRTGHMLGTPSYMSPEQCRGLKDIDHRADLWALGVIAYECLVGKVPFEGEVLGDLLLRICMDPLPIPSQHATGLPSTFDAWFAKAVARDRSTRFQSAVELASTLSELSSSLGLATTLSVREAIEPSRPSFPRLAAVATAATSSRQSPNTETNTTVGLGGGAGRLLDRRTRMLAMAGVAACAAVGLWALGGNKREATGSVSVDVQSLRPPYEVTPKVIRPGVPSGRRRTATPASADNGALHATATAGGRDVDLRSGGAYADIAPSAPSSPHLLPPDALPPNAPPVRAQPSSLPGPGRSSAPEHVPDPAFLSHPAGSSGAASATAGGPPLSGSSPTSVRAGPARTLTPLRGTAAIPSTPSRAPALQPDETAIRRIR